MTLPDATASDTGGESSRVLILAPTGRDSEATAKILTRAGFVSRICQNTEELCQAMVEGAGVAVVTAEALTPEAVRRIAATLDSQPPWSEIPLMIFVASPDMDRAARSFEGLGPRAHVTLVDRPIRINTLVSSTRTALRSRMRQYQMRDLLAEQDRLLQNERALARRLSGLADASLEIASALSLGEVLQMITDQAAKVINASFALIWMQVEENSETRSVQAASNVSIASVDEASQRALKTLTEKINTTVRLGPELLLDLVGGPAFMGASSVIVAPLQEREGRIIGVLLLGEKENALLTTDDEAVLTQLAQMASAAVQNARLYREAQEANRAKDDFLATLAHELRTPMTGILGWVQILKNDAAMDSDAVMAIQMIENSSRVQARLVEDLLDVSRIIAGKLRVELRPVELAPVVESVVETFRARALESEITLTAKIEERPLSVFGDETRLHQVIWNLLSNALKFTPAKGQVNVDLSCQDSRAVLRVRDSGRGISSEFLPHVFERFRQADNTTTRTESGLGLGLAIVRHLVELQGGEVGVESAGLGEGSTFIVTLPTLAVRIEPADVSGLSQQPEAPDLSGISILVVDDDTATGESVAMVLSELGADARAVTSVTAAVRVLRGFDADVVVSDIAMPGEDGYAMMRRLRELGKVIPAMALTGYGRPEDRTRILASGFQRYVQKPVEPLALARAVAELLSE